MVIGCPFTMTVVVKTVRTVTALSAIAKQLWTSLLNEVVVNFVLDYIIIERDIQLGMTISLPTRGNKFKYCRPNSPTLRIS